MSSEPIASAAPPPPSDPDSLVRLLREELIKTQLMVLDLNDQLRTKETEKADAVAILAQSELLLEAKVNQLAELDRRSQAQAAELCAQLDAATAEGQARELALRDLSSRLDSANRESTRLNELAESRARELADTQARLSTTAARLAEHEHALALERRRLDKIFSSSLWRLGRPWRALFGPKV